MKYFTRDKSTSSTGKHRYFVTSKLSENIHETPEGYLICIGVPIARTGEMVYGEGETPLEVDEAGQIAINREAEEVFRPETIASFEGKPVTITHPTDFVSPQNWSRLAKGTVQNVRRGEGENENDLIADLLITDSIAIGLVKNGLREVSCGYEADYEQTGEGRGIQKNIIGNHLALVDQGRAGSSYAINDHKGMGANKMSLKDKVKKLFAKAQDEAMKAVEDAEAEARKGESKDDAEKDAKLAALKEKKDALEKEIAELEATADSDEEEAPKKKKKDEEAKDDEEGGSDVADRLKSLEAAVAKILDILGDEDEDDEEESESEDADEDDGDDDEAEDEAPKGKMTGDTASRVEILAPGMNAKAKDAKAKALKAAYGTKDGKRVIDSLTGGKAPAFNSAEKVETLFIAASELLKVSRSSDLSKSKQTRDFDSGAGADEGAMTPERMNEINRKHFNRA